MLLPVATATIISLSILGAASPAGTGGPEGYSYEGTYPNYNACVQRAAVLERNYNIQAFECSGRDTAPDRDLWVKWG